MGKTWSHAQRMKYKKMKNRHQKTRGSKDDLPELFGKSKTRKKWNYS
jgi:hypothetical protein